MNIFKIILFIGAIILFASASLYADWMINGNLIEGYTPDIYNSLAAILPDNNWGAIVVWRWEDFVFGSFGHYYAQRIDLMGNIVWSKPVRLSGNFRWDYGIRIVPDNAGGAFALFVNRDAAFTEYLIAEHIYSDGSTSYISAVVCTPRVKDLDIIPDGYYGAIACWINNDNELYIQAINPDNSARWNSDVMVKSSSYIAAPRMTSDGSFGAIITWFEGRSLYAQHVDASGNIRWNPSGNLLCIVNSIKGRQSLIPDGSGGAFVVWEDKRNYNSDIYAQRIDKDGNLLWNPSGVPVCTASEDQEWPFLVQDGSGGVIIVWRSGDSQSNYDVYAQRLDADGNPLWGENGIAVASRDGNERNQRIVSDGNGGAIISWVDDSSGDYDIYIQRLSPSGEKLWGANGAPVTTAPGDQDVMFMTSNVSGGAILAWTDFRNSDLGEIYAMFVYEGMPPVETQVSYFSIAPLNEVVRLSWKLTSMEDGAEFMVLRSVGGRDQFSPLADISVEGGEDLTFQALDRSVEPGEKYSYRVDLVDKYGRHTLFETEGVIVPQRKLALYQNHPNPFNPSTRIEYYLPENSHVKLEIYDASGRKIVELVNTQQERGEYSVVWNGTDSMGKEMPSGVYFYKLVAGNRQITKKMILLR